MKNLRIPSCSSDSEAWKEIEPEKAVTGPGMPPDSEDNDMTTSNKPRHIRARRKNKR